MKYIIMCGGRYDYFKRPRQLTRIRGEPIVARTIRLLREVGVYDIAISSNDEAFDGFDVPVLSHKNEYHADMQYKTTGYWVDAFYPMENPACYLFGDVVFSPEAIQTIVETETDCIEFFASAPPFSPAYAKPYAEPFALKVENQKFLRDAVLRVKDHYESGRFLRKPIMWELWSVITGGQLNGIDYDSYTKINDYTCDIDRAEDARKIEACMS